MRADIETSPLDALDRRLLDEFQRDFPMVPAPYAEIGRRVGVAEDEVLARLDRLASNGCISRIGPVLATNRAGASTLAAMPVPAARLETVAALVSRFPEVNHNYEREHELNLWFVLVAPARRRIEAVLAEIAEHTGIEVLELPMEMAYHIDLGFPLWTSSTER